MEESLAENETLVRMGLKKMQRRRLRLYLLLVAEALAFTVLSRLVQELAPVVRPFVSFMLGILLFGLCLWTFGRVRGLPCPACRSPFCFRKGRRFYYYNDFTRSCLNCGLRLNGSNIRAILESGSSAEQGSQTSPGR
jgi:hypothetical protein